jgi:hypothetical protein
MDLTELELQGVGVASFGDQVAVLKKSGEICKLPANNMVQKKATLLGKSINGKLLNFGKYIVYESNGDIKCMDHQSWAVKSLGKHEKVCHLTMSQCGQYLASTGGGKIKIFSTT